jgi:di/tricarboxylate transporter
MQGSRKDRQERPFLKWCPVIVAGLTIIMIPPPTGITPQGWRLLAIFASTIVGSIFQPIPGAAVVMLGVSAAAFTGALPVAEALGGYADPIVWMVLAAFFISRGMVNTGLGRRVAFVFIRTLGKRSLGYALVCTRYAFGHGDSDAPARVVFSSCHQEFGRSLIPSQATATRLGVPICLVYQ